MKYAPSIVLHNKFFKIRKYKTISKPSPIVYGQYGIKALESAFLSNFFIERFHLFLRRKLKKRGKVWFRVIPFVSKTKKPLEVRMGKGKGPHDCWIYHVKKAQIFMEITVNNLCLKEKIFRALYRKLPLKVKILCLKE